MAPKSKRRGSSGSNENKPPQLIIPCVTDLKTLLTRFSSLDIQFCGNVLEFVRAMGAENMSILENHNNRNKQPTQTTSRTRTEHTPQSKKPKLIDQKNRPRGNNISKTRAARRSTSADRSSDDKDAKIISNKTARSANRARSNTPQDSNAFKKNQPASKTTTATTAATKQSEPDAKPGTAGSKQALVPSKTSKRLAAKKPTKSSEERDLVRYQTRIVDDTVLYTFAQLVEKHHLKEPPKDALELCNKFTINLADIGLMAPSATSTARAAAGQF